MSEDIVSQINQMSLAENHVHLKARIEELEADLRHAKISEVFWRDGWNALDQDKRAVEAKLAKAVVALEAFKAFDELPTVVKRPDVFEIKVRKPILRALAELTGGKDE